MFVVGTGLRAAAVGLSIDVDSDADGKLLVAVVWTSVDVDSGVDWRLFWMIGAGRLDATLTMVAPVDVLESTGGSACRPPKPGMPYIGVAPGTGGAVATDGRSSTAERRTES